MGEYKLIVRFDAKPQLTGDQRQELKETIRLILSTPVRGEKLKCDVIYIKLLNITDKE